MYENFTLFARKITHWILGTSAAACRLLDHRATPAEYFPVNNSRNPGFYEPSEDRIMTGFYWECGLFPILMNDSSKCFRNKDV
jgi:hypothetical protein